MVPKELPRADDMVPLPLQRLRHCEQMQAALQPIRRDLDEYTWNLSSVADSTERLQVALQSALSFSELEIAQELAAQAPGALTDSELGRMTVAMCTVAGMCTVPPLPPPLLAAAAAVGFRPISANQSRRRQLRRRVVAESVPTSEGSKHV